MKLKDLAKKIGAQLVGDGEIDIIKVANLRTAAANEISFLSDSRYKDVLGSSKAGAVIVRNEDAPQVKTAALVVNDPYAGFAKAAALLDTTPPVAEGIGANVCIADDAVIGKDVSLGCNVVIGSGAQIGDKVQIASNCVIGPKVKIGAYTRIYPNVSIYHGTQIGAHCLIQSGAVIGSDGFGYANENGRWLKIPQTGRVRIGDFVEIGACTCIDRGALDETVIEDNVIIDNLCQVAHNVHIGMGTAVAGGTVFAGSVTIGRFCIIGGTSVFNGHITICDKVTISGMCMVMRSIDKPGIYSSGIPAQTNREWRITASRVLHINEMYRKVNALERELAKLKSVAARFE